LISTTALLHINRTRPKFSSNLGAINVGHMPKSKKIRYSMSPTLKLDQRDIKHVLRNNSMGVEVRF